MATQTKHFLQFVEVKDTPVNEHDIRILYCGNEVGKINYVRSAGEYIVRFTNNKFWIRRDLATVTKHVEDLNSKLRM